LSERAAKPAGVSDVGRGAVFMVGAAFLFAAMGVMVQLAARTLPNAMVVFLRSSLGLLLLTPWFFGRSEVGLRTLHLKEHLLRGVLGMAGMYCFFYAIAHLRLADALLLNYSLPLFVPLVERVWLREPVPKGPGRALLLGSCGLLLILKPGLTILRPAALVGLLAAILSAMAQVGVRGLTRTEPVIRIVYYFGLVSTGISLFPALSSWLTPGAAAWPALLGLGLTATVAQLFMTRADACAPAARVGPFIYTSVVLGALFDARVRPANGVVTGCVAMMQCRVHGEGDTIAGCS
jgi:drug/metabolite transporter (DMT)-like permease